MSFVVLNKVCLMLSVDRSRGILASLIVFCLTGCPANPPAAGTPAAPPAAPSSVTTPAPAETPTVVPAPPTKPARVATASAADVQAAKARVDALGSGAKYAPKDGNRLTEIVIQDGSNVTAEDIALFGKLSDLEKLHILNCRTLDDEMAAKLSGLKGLKSLALTNSTISDATVELISVSFPNVTDLDLSSNTNMSNSVLKLVSKMSQLQRLTLVQTKVNDIGTGNLAKLQELRAVDLRGNMQAGDMTLEVLAELPKLAGLKHRSSSVTDSGMEALSRNQTLGSLLIQDFKITDESGPHLAKFKKLTQLEIFRCQGFGTDGVLALKGMGLTRLTLRDLSSVDNRAMAVFDDLPQLRRLYLHELASVSDTGLKHLASLQSLELLDIWSVSQMTDATIDVILALPKLKELSIRATSITPEGAKRLEAKTWTKLNLGEGTTDEAAAP